MHEVVTLQLGNRANYLATHFWNIQESYFTYPTPTDPTPAPSPVDHDIHFRPGIGADGSDTYTPRTLIYDFQSNFGGLRKLNALYDTLKPDQAVRGLWDGIHQTQIVPPIQPIQYQINLETGLPTPQLHAHDVRYWSDFNRLFYHPRSIIPLSPQSFSSSLHATESWSNGADLFKDIDTEVDILDRDIRPFVEECDFLSAFQVFSSVDDSWGGYAASYVESLREEYGKKGLWVWGVENRQPTDRAKQYQRLANSARSLRAMSQDASAYIRLADTPTSLPEYVQLDAQSEWSTAALMCAAMESVTLPARLRDGASGNSVNLATIEDTLNSDGKRNVWTIQARASKNNADSSGETSRYQVQATGNSSSQASDPRTRFYMVNSAAAIPSAEDVDVEPSSFDIDFTPQLPTAQTTFPSLRSDRARTESHTFAQLESYRHVVPSQITRPNTSTSHEANMQRYYESSPVVSVYNTSLGFPLLDSYPDTLFRLPSRNRQILVDAALSTTSRTKYDVLGLRDMVAGRLGRGLGLFETDEVEVMYDDLTRIGEAYDWGWEGSDEEDDDDD